MEKENEDVQDKMKCNEDETVVTSNGNDNEQEEGGDVVQQDSTNDAGQVQEADDTHVGLNSQENAEKEPLTSDSDATGNERKDHSTSPSSLPPPPPNSDNTSTSDTPAEEQKPPPQSSKPPKSQQARFFFKAVGNAPIMKRNKFNMTINESKKFNEIISWLRNQLHLEPTDSLFVYVNGAFAPSPDESLSNLFECFQIQGELIINYSIVGAWG